MLQIGAPGHPLGCRSEAQMIIQIVGMIGCPTTEDLKVLCGEFLRTDSSSARSCVPTYNSRYVNCVFVRMVRACGCLRKRAHFSKKSLP